MFMFFVSEFLTNGGPQYFPFPIVRLDVTVDSTQYKSDSTKEKGISCIAGNIT